MAGVSGGRGGSPVAVPERSPAGGRIRWRSGTATARTPRHARRGWLGRVAGAAGWRGSASAAPPVPGLPWSRNPGLLPLPSAVPPRPVPVGCEPFLSQRLDTTAERGVVGQGCVHAEEHDDGMFMPFISARNAQSIGVGHQPAAPGRPCQHRRSQPPPRPRPAADATAASDAMSDFAGSLHHGHGPTGSLESGRVSGLLCALAMTLGCQASRVNDRMACSASKGGTEFPSWAWMEARVPTSSKSSG